MIKHDLGLVFTPNIGEISFYMLKENFIDIYRVKAGATVREMIARYYNGEIEPLTASHPAEDSEVEIQKRIPDQNKYPPAEPEVLRLLAPQRGRTAIG